MHRSVLLAAVVAGVIAGAVTAGFHSLFIEPLVERAIQLEERARGSGGQAVRPPVVARSAQRRGLIVGFLIFGAIWGLLFGLAAPRLLAWLPLSWPAALRGFVLALLVGWSVSVFPFLKYPANPPGVGEPGTIGLRQQRYFGLVALSLAGLALAAGVYRSLCRRTPMLSPRAFGVVTVAVYGGYMTVLYAIMPANPDPVAMPADLVDAFRTISLAGLVLFWMVFGGTFGWLARNAPQPRT
jgi:predicted cobalt transporter CbtA